MNALNSSKNALITGGTSKIGREVAKYLKSLGYNVIIHYCKNERFVAENLGNYKFYQADFKKDDIKTFWSEIIADNQKIDLLVNNASSFKNDFFTEQSYNNFSENFAVNFYAASVLSECFSKQHGLKEANIINFTDYIVDKIPHNKFYSYYLSKVCLAKMTKIAAIELAPNIRVNSIALGAVTKNENQSQEHFELTVENSLTLKATTIKEINDTISFILDNNSLTGTQINLDGGKSLVATNYI